MEKLEKLKNSSHLVILGAGATMATIPNGDKNGRKSSVMNNFISELGLNDCLNKIKFKTKSNNLEDIYSEINEREDALEIKLTLETAIRNHFSQLRLPDKPTIYDLLVLSLRRKDAIASFNWDPLLLEAFHRVSKITKDLPELIFLHGNVHAGICRKDNQYGHIRSKCKICGNRFEFIPLLYPIKNKDYTKDIFISEQWNKIHDYLQQSLLITIFGYGAPKTDEGALNLLKKGYGTNTRYLDNVEIIDIKEDRDELYDSWEHFSKISNGHLELHTSFFDSYISEFPRRSVEEYYKRNITGWWGESSFSLKSNYETFAELENDFKDILKTEVSLE
ncbi:hypothetical protein [Flavobacterium restrictum]|uniref:Deacetylase sirtuin-type domain-containing protein n=1 Tax=Flavobacterium restrictum TaxID=2594428 RepID=A0A553E730_9FLAO|nr:hypothetical protein [Flavobacterium restrictum]TRX40854.1 hypothetical protein FNW21_06010 [Flavobacterium restrictum]